MNRWGVTVGALLLLAGGCSLTGSYVVQGRLDRLPRMTCTELARNGPPADGQVLLTDLRPCQDFVATRFDGSLDLYVPAYPAGLAQEPRPADLAFLLQVWDDDERHRLFDNPGPVELTCWAIRGARAVDFCRGPGEIEKWARDGLEEKYPRIRLAKMTVLTVGHGNTPTAYRVQSAFHYGVGELVAGVMILTWGALRVWRRLGSQRAPNVSLEFKGSQGG
jgi:hypothetical protein